MLAFHEGTPARNCQGATRRAALKAGFLGLAGLTLPGLLRHRAELPAKEETGPARRPESRTGQPSGNPPRR